MNDYTSYILNNASHTTPKNVFGLLEGCACWDSVDACNEVERLQKEGKIKLAYSTGTFFQHKYFVKCTEDPSSEREFAVMRQRHPCTLDAVRQILGRN